MYHLAENTLTRSRERGAGMMDVIVGALVVLILGSILLHIFRLGYAMYRLNEASATISQELTDARELAIKGNKKVSVIFDSDLNVFGIDRNGNGKLERGEAGDLPGDVVISEGTEISFLPSGSPPAKSKKPKITISNSKGSRNISVSSMGSVEIE
ncbi:MAG TPA: GspH/FimT family pseudopilin [Blastocatellia bacterium]|nr:GspH/FimT family pseudopilin [Blastocatellia bacterium]